MSYDRGDVIVAADPFKDDDSAARPFLVVDYPETPFHGEQYITLSLTTRTWYDERIPLTNEDWIEGGAPDTTEDAEADAPEDETQLRFTPTTRRPRSVYSHPTATSWER